jgi:4-amino-4-deoxy-L-arabinose transferase-like glycosyltransferase
MAEPSPQPTARALPRRFSALALFALLVALWGTVGSLSRAGLWAPELETAELSRRIAHGLLGAGGLGAPGDEGVPTRGELGRGELPFTAIALGFRCFGLSPWAGRLPLALMALAGLAATFLVVARLASRRAAWLSVLCLATMPLYFLQARTLLGDIATMAANAVAFAGLALALFDERNRALRFALLGLALLGLSAGFLSRGLVLGVGVPTLGVGTSFIVRTFAGIKSDGFGLRVAALSLLCGILAVGAGAAAIELTPAEAYSMLLGATPSVLAVRPTFDLALSALGYALFPWSALLPAAIGRVLRPSRAELEARDDRELGLRLAALSTAATALIAGTALLPALGLLPYAAPGACAVLIALALEDLNRGARGSRWLGLSVGALIILLVLDIRNFPEKALVPLGVADAVYPPGFAAQGFRWVLAAGVFVVTAFFFVVEAPPGFARLPRFRHAKYAAWPRALTRLWAGNLWFGVLTLGSALVVFEVLLLLSDRHLHWRALEGVGETTRLAVRAGWLGVLVFCLGPPLVLLLRDSVRSVLDPAGSLACAVDGPLPPIRPFSRGSAAAVIVGIAGALLSLGYYPALMQQISPKQAFARYLRDAKAGEPLGLLGVDAAGARYESGVVSRQFDTADSALDWLFTPGPRRFLGFRATDLAALNAGHRARTTPRRNLSILEATSSEMLLATNQLRAGDVDRNPLARSVLSNAPEPEHPLAADLAGKLEVLGWDLNQQGRPVAALVASVDYEFTIYFRVNEPLAGSWDVFIHMDGVQQRYNGDHPLLGGSYAPAFWLPGDFIADHHVIRLAPNFRAGTYRLFFGLFSGERRLEVRQGLHEEDRLIAGSVSVR